MVAQQVSGLFGVTGLPEIPCAIDRLGVLMRPRLRDPREALGVLNPGCAHGRDGALYLYPREVAEGNCSCVGLARVQFSEEGEPVAAQRLGIALEPEERYEYASDSMYGCEDPRVTVVPALDRYVMTYVATTPLGPKVALAISDDALTWERVGLADFALEYDLNLNVYGNKDALLFPEPVTGPDGRPALALLHRPMYQIYKHLEERVELPPPAGVSDTRESIWISYADLDAVRDDISALQRWSSHQLLAAPEFEWESVKIGGGAPPLLTHLGWLLIYHGVGWDPRAVGAADPAHQYLRYCAGAMVLDRDDPRQVLYRSPVPVLEPIVREECEGVVSHVVFPTGLDPRTPPAPGSRVDVYYGMADTAIGVGWLTLPDTLPDDVTELLETLHESEAAEFPGAS